MNSSIHSSLAVVVLLGITAAAAPAAEPADKCQSSKLKESAKYASCRLKAEAKGVLAGQAPDFTKCAEKFALKFDHFEEKAGPGVCRTEGDDATIGAHVAGATNDIAVLLAGGVLSGCSEELATCADDLDTCGQDLTSCEADLSTCSGTVGLLQTGQMTCFGQWGEPVACSGTGHDGDLRVGFARSYTDNGNGTITDNRTSLMWEKLSDDDSIHDRDHAYLWSEAITVKIAALNSGSGFAGFTDWRLPNRFELDSLVDIGVVLPSIPPAFNLNCTPGCTVLECSCVQPTGPAAGRYWSSSSRVDMANWAWYVQFYNGYAWSDDKGNRNLVRAVRGGR